MRRIVTSAVLVCLFVLFSASPGFSASTSPGGNSVYESATGVPLPVGPAPLLVGTISKGLRSRVLEVNAMLTVGVPFGPGIELSLLVDVNGVLMEPLPSGPFGAVQSCVDIGFGASGCTISGTWWLDLDAAEAASPGVFLRKPLTITLFGGLVPGPAPPPAGIPADISFSAVMEKK